MVKNESLIWYNLYFGSLRNTKIEIFNDCSELLDFPIFVLFKSRGKLQQQAPIENQHNVIQSLWVFIGPIFKLKFKPHLISVVVYREKIRKTVRK